MMGTEGIRDGSSWATRGAPLRPAAFSAQRLDKFGAAHETANACFGGTGPAMITGFNTNVHHRGLLFHVQTEDSGRAHPHLISHVYYGGTIIASEKSDYSDRVGAEDLDRQVRVLMEAQHKSMISRLEQGEYDKVINERLPDQVPSPLAQTSPLAETAPSDEPSASVEAPESGQPPPEHDAHRAFGEGIVSQKPLDEVILDYLVEKSRSSRSGG